MSLFNKFDLSFYSSVELCELIGNISHELKQRKLAEERRNFVKKQVSVRPKLMSVPRSISKFLPTHHNSTYFAHITRVKSTKSNKIPAYNIPENKSEKKTILRKYKKPRLDCALPTSRENDIKDTYGDDSKPIQSKHYENVKRQVEIDLDDIVAMRKLYYEMKDYECQK
jgi:hypothetical protein